MKGKSSILVVTNKIQLFFTNTIVLQKRSETKKQGCLKRRRPQLRWEDCVKIDLRKAQEEEKWREKANNRSNGKNNKSSHTVELQLTSLTPTTGKQEEEQPASVQLTASELSTKGSVSSYPSPRSTRSCMRSDLR